MSIKRPCGRTLSIFTMVTLFLAVAPDAVGQSPAVPLSAHAAKCGKCQLKFERVVVLGSPNNEVLLTAFSRPVRDRRGNYLAWSAEQGVIAVFDQEGRQRQTFGRRGEGPGEMTTNFLPILPLDDGSIAVFQPGFVHFFDAAFRFLHKVAAPVRLFGNPVQLDAQHLLLPGLVRTPERVGQPLHLFTLSGRFGSSFGGDIATFDARKCLACITRHLAVADRAGRIWVARHRSYALEQFHVDGTRLRSMPVVGSSWFPQKLGAKLESGELVANATIPVIRAVWSDSAGLVYVLGGALASGRVREDLAPVRSGVRSRPSASTTVPRVDVIDVLDTRTRELLVSQRFPDVPPFRESMGGGFLFNHVEDTNGYVRIEVWTVKLQRATFAEK